MTVRQINRMIRDAERHGRHVLLSTPGDPLRAGFRVVRCRSKEGRIELLALGATDHWLTLVTDRDLYEM